MLYGIDWRKSTGQKKIIKNKILFYRSTVVLLTSIFILIFAWLGGFLGINGVGIGSTIFAFIFLIVLNIVISQIIQELIYSAAGLLLDPYGMADHEKARKFLYDYLLYGELSLLIITEGMVDGRSKDSPLIKLGGRGPGMVKIDDVSVVLIEQEGFHRILKAGTHFLDHSERIKGIVDLQLQEMKKTLKNVFTKDNIPLEMTMSIVYRIRREQKVLAKRHMPGPKPEAVINSILVASDWKAQTITAIDGKTRDFIAGYNLKDIHGTYPNQVDVASPSASKEIEDESPRVSLQRRLTEVLNTAVERWGAEIVTVTIEEIDMPNLVKETLHEAWGDIWKNKIKIQRAETDCQVAEVKREITLTNAQSTAEARRIQNTTIAEAQLDVVRRADKIRQLTGSPIDEKVLSEMLRNTMVSNAETRSAQEKRDSAKDQKVRE
jgi:regulator of protease activity HflC (stomatin/prohibitin superfamily)